MTQTVRFGSNNTEFLLASAPSVAGNVTSFAIEPSDAVTAEAVLAVVSGADSYTITTDDVTGTVNTNCELSSNVGIDKSSGNIVFSMRQKSADEIQRAQMQAQIDAQAQAIAELSVLVAGGNA